MSNNDKKIAGRAFTVPLTVAVLLSVLFIVTILFADIFPFASQEVDLGGFEQEEIKTVTDFQPSGEVIKKQELDIISPNTIIGSISVFDSDYPIIYNASRVNAMGKFNISDKSDLIGEAGASYLSVQKGDSAKLKMLAENDSIYIDTFYSSYEYKIVKITAVKNENDIFSCADGISSAVVLFTDNSVGVGTSDEYFVCVGEMVSGSRVTE